MAGYKGANFNDRMTTAANAKKALVEKFKSKPGPDDPEVAARAAERLAIAAAREVRAAERKAAREAELARLAEIEAARLAELAAQEAARIAEAAAQRKRDAEAVVDSLNLEAERKAARDARYAARKARR
jgi:hypothetical protein